MMPQLLTLLCTGLCAAQGSRETKDPLPKPSLRAWPSSVVPHGSNITLQCRAPTKDVDFALRKGDIFLDSSPSLASTEGLAEFHLTDLRNSQAGVYTCELYRLKLPYMRSLPSNLVLLLVTGYWPKPSLQAQQRGVVTAGDNVTLQCQRPDDVFRPIMFALLKAGATGPIQLRTPVGNETDFSLQTVTAEDSGNYSCVYFQIQAPFWTSLPSEPLEIRVRETIERNSPEGAETGLGAVGIALVAVSALLILLGAFLVYRCSRRRHGAALHKMAKRSCSSKEPEKVETRDQPEKESRDTSAAMVSCPPASDEASQVSRAEEPYGVTYAELDIRALNEAPSSQVEQPLETCVYLTLKT
ncbi:T-cell-interacting, activating receptor on myeloid cells protein 1 isoform X3 [Hyaena hyaena]|uniref:T-cell-interacting, activating receptor on myeloid cells protein 1 isoform X3 n=1 Tax=Hyaena hyaena TaxID=95912 RepID=UPI001922AA59|nr:T-cell-interacting, activating receptor on myeloid cells protein 1 isoform X3 [Hyaena hyaena]